MQSDPLLNSCEQATNMNTNITTHWTNGSRLLLNDSNDTLDLYNIHNNKTDYLKIATLIVSVLGLPGNLLLIAVYVRKMTTSTRVYMFALAVSDSFVCLCGIVPCLTWNLITRSITLFIFDVSVIFSMFLLAFVAIERLIAVRYPHSFNMKAKRAKTALLIIAVAAVVYTTMVSVALLFDNIQFVNVADLSAIFVSVMIMTTCYIVMAATLLKNTRTSRNRIAAVTLTGSSEPGPLSVVQKGRVTTPAKDLVLEHNSTTSMRTDQPTMSVTIRSCEGVVRHENPGTSCVSTVVKVTARGQSGPSAISPTTVSATTKTTAAQTKMYKNMLLLFIITAVFGVCWMPHWLFCMGIAVSGELRRIFVLNSVVNPFIYGVASAMFREDVRYFYRQTRIKLDAFYH